MHICFFTKYEIDWGSSRNRIGIYLDRIKKNRHTYKIIHVIPKSLALKWIGGRENYSFYDSLRSIWYTRVLKHLKFIWIIIIAKRFDRIVIQKVNICSPFLWILRYRNENMIFDFDDYCFWGGDLIQKSSINLMERLRLWRRGIQHAKALSYYKYSIAGNRRLADLAISFKGQGAVAIIPTGIDCNFYRKKDSNVQNPIAVIGWSGTGENHLRHLELLAKPFKSLAQRKKFMFKLVGASGSGRIRQLFEFLGDGFECIDWVQPQQLPEAIRSFDIGVMPLKDDEEARMKCGFKALEYMASGVATVVSPVGINKDIIQDGINGFWASDGDEWLEKLTILIDDLNLRNRLTKEGRKTVEESYSLNKTAQHFLKVLDLKN